MNSLGYSYPHGGMTDRYEPFPIDIKHSSGMTRVYLTDNHLNACFVEFVKRHTGMSIEYIEYFVKGSFVSNLESPKKSNSEKSEEVLSKKSLKLLLL